MAVCPWQPEQMEAVFDGTVMMSEKYRNHDPDLGTSLTGMKYT